MKTFVSRRSWRLLPSRFSARPSPFYPLVSFGVLAQLLHVRVYFFTIAPIEPGEAASVVIYPVFGPWYQHERVSFPPNGQLIPRPDTQLSQDLNRQGYLVLAAYSAHGGLTLTASNIGYRRLRNFTLVI